MLRRSNTDPARKSRARTWRANMSETTCLFREYLERAISRADGTKRDTTSMGADSLQTWVRNQGELEVSHYANELITMIWRQDVPLEDQSSSSTERWRIAGSREDQLGAYVELTLARTAEATLSARQADVDDRRKRAREYDEHEDPEYEE